MLHARARTTIFRIAPAAGLLALVVAAAACTDTPTSADAGPQPTAISADIVTPPQTAVLLKRKVPLARDVKVTALIGPRGGSLKIPEAGFHLSLSSEALPAGVTSLEITVTALAGDAVAYQFQPHGFVFAKDKGIAATQDLSGTTLAGHRGNTTLEAVYFADESDIDASTGTVTFAEVFPTSLTASGQRVHWRIPHFSGYAVSTGRQASAGAGTRALEP